MDDSDEDLIYLNVPSMLGNKQGMPGLGLAMDLMLLIWWPLKAPFDWDERLLAERFKQLVPARGYTEQKLRSYAQAAKTYFTRLPNGLWAPSPEYFSLTNGNPGSQS